MTTPIDDSSRAAPASDAPQTRADMLKNRVAKNRKKLLPWAAREKITCYRLYDRDIPEIPLAVDWYDGRLHIAVYESANDAATQKDEDIRRLALSLGRSLDVRDEDVYVKLRRRGSGGSQYTAVDHRRNLVKVTENSLQFLVNLSDYIDTGLFLDHRILRRIVMAEATGKRFLNLFAYTGSFSVYAAAGGAVSTVTADLSHTYLDWAEENMRVNGFTGDAHRFVRDDVLGALTEGRVTGMYDLVVLDPPTVSKSKSMPRSLDIERDHPALLNGALRCTAPGGTVFFSNNLKKFKLRASEIDCDTIVDITEKTRPFDFRSPFVHHAFRLTKSPRPT